MKDLKAVSTGTSLEEFGCQEAVKGGQELVGDMGLGEDYFERQEKQHYIWRLMGVT